MGLRGFNRSTPLFRHRRDSTGHRNRKFEQLLTDALAQRVSPQTRAHPAIEHVVKHEVERVEAGKLESIDPGLNRFGKKVGIPRGDGVRRQRRLQIGRKFRSAGDDPDVFNVALIAAASTFVARHSPRLPLTTAAAGLLEAIAVAVHGQDADVMGQAPSDPVRAWATPLTIVFAGCQKQQIRPNRRQMRGRRSQEAAWAPPQHPMPKLS